MAEWRERDRQHQEQERLLKPVPTDASYLRAQWNDVLIAVRERCGLKQQAGLRAVRDIAIGQDAEKVVLALAFGNNKFARDLITETETARQVQEILAEMLGQPVVILCQEGEIARVDE